METRRLGKTGHLSTVVVFGGAAFWLVNQAEADAALELAAAHGINHIDVSPTYGQAEIHLGPWLKDKKHRESVFLGCKTMKRDKTEAAKELKESLKTLQTDYFDLYQFHGVDDMATLHKILGPDGALTAVREAQRAGVVKYIGITGHKPSFLAEAFKVFDFDTVMFPLNRVEAAHPSQVNEYKNLLKIAKEKDAGTMALKAVTKSPWDRQMHMYKTWYEPFDTQEEIDKSLWWTLSQDITAACMPGDLRLWPMVIDAAERYKKMSAAEQDKAMEAVKKLAPLFPKE
jgi:aryl-alcohol dehydrogenase-like predicted oxidoreductase